jgi:hypothetical protein
LPGTIQLGSRPGEALRLAPLGSSVLPIFVFSTANEAHAASVVLKDATRDTYAPADRDNLQLVPTQSARGDVTSVRIRHSVKAVDIVIRT